ncbi:Hypothetical protein A7982_09189 [Minicystis rosea]|nr:Hypothetical protein A7982_09189 [Minicystis rosea]
MNARAPHLTAILCAGGLLFAACTSKTAADADDVPRTVTSMINASAVISACPDGRKMNAKAAIDAINKLVEPCAQVPGGKAHFAATLLPGGKIELGSPEGKAAEGVVPTCVLRHGLSHRVLLNKPCTFDVKLEERKLGPNGG